MCTLLASAFLYCKLSHKCIAYAVIAIQMSNSRDHLGLETSPDIFLMVWSWSRGLWCRSQVSKLLFLTSLLIRFGSFTWKSTCYSSVIINVIIVSSSSSSINCVVVLVTVMIGINWLNHDSTLLESCNKRAWNTHIQVTNTDGKLRRKKTPVDKWALININVTLW